MAWQTIQDAEVANYKPVTARLARKLRDCGVALVSPYLLSARTLGSSSPMATSADSLTTVKTVYLYIPAALAGPILLWTPAGLDGFAGTTPPNENSRFRLKVGAATGSVKSKTDDYLDISFTPGAAGVYAVEFQAGCASGSTDHEASITWTGQRLELTRLD